MTRPYLAMALGLSAVVLVLASTLPEPAMAQNASQIARVRAGQSCPGCNLFQGDFSYLEVRGLNLSGARLRQANLSLSVMNRTRFTNADLRDVDAYGAVFSSASFVGTFLEGADCSGARLDGVNFSGAQMQGATGLTQRQLDRACGDAATRLPGSLRIPAC